MITGLQTHSRKTLVYGRTQAQLDTIVSGRVNQCTMTVAPPPRPVFSDPTNILASPTRKAPPPSTAMPFSPLGANDTSSATGGGGGGGGATRGGGGGGSSNSQQDPKLHPVGILTPPSLPPSSPVASGTESSLGPRPVAAPVARLLPGTAAATAHQHHPAAVKDRHMSSPYFDANKLMLDFGGGGDASPRSGRSPTGSNNGPGPQSPAAARRSVGAVTDNNRR